MKINQHSFLSYIEIDIRIVEALLDLNWKFQNWLLYSNLRSVVVIYLCFIFVQLHVFSTILSTAASENDTASSPTVSPTTATRTRAIKCYCSNWVGKSNVCWIVYRGSFHLIIRCGQVLSVSIRVWQLKSQIRSNRAVVN